ncbi:MAG: HD domain-containing protein [Bacteroidales bacterium]|nr:HD domain-containing protein [Bacteroidales bacterium]
MENQKVLMPDSYRKELYTSFYNSLPDDVKHSAASMEQIEAAFNFAYDAHNGVYRKGGEHDPYITHPVAVALIVANEMGLGATAIVSALLHDVVEDTDHTLEEIEEKFGPNVADIVDGLTKITNHEAERNGIINTEQSDTFKKVLLSVKRTPMVLFVKIADRLHNMRTIGDMKDEQKRRKANENLYIYVLIADQLGLYDIKNELEDLSFKNYLANKYEKIDTLVKETAPARNKLLSDFKLSLMRVLVTTGVTCRLAVVKKSYFNIYQMMQNDAMAFEDIDNFQTVRIIIDKEPGEDEQSIYLKHFNLYAAIINKYTQKENSHRDYINKPKDNGFKALVFTVLYQGSWVEIQILTAENDLAAHKGYYPNNPERTGLKVLQKKMVSFNSDDDTDTIIRVFRTLVEHHVSSIYVYSPDGKIVELPEGSTVLDYAYSIHTSLGNHFVAAQVGSNIVYKDYILKSTDKVQVITSPSVKPDNSWMKYLKSDHSKEALSKYLRSHQCTIDYDKDRGEMEFNRLMCENHIIPTPKFLGLLLAFYKAPSSEVFFRDIAQGNVKDLLENAKKLKISSNKWDLDFDLPEQPVDSPVVDIDYKKPYKLTKGLHYMLPNCCRPIPGDEAFAYVGDDGVLYVHRKECSFTKERLATRGKEITSVIWDDSIDNALAYVKLHGSNRLGLIRDVGDIVAREHVNIKSFNINENDRLFDGCLLVYIHNTAQLNKLMTALSAVTNVIKVFRTNYVNGRYIAVS